MLRTVLLILAVALIMKLAGWNIPLWVFVGPVVALVLVAVLFIAVIYGLFLWLLYWPSGRRWK